MTKLSLAAVFSLFFFANSAYAAKEFKYSKDKKIEAIIGVNELNRIGIIGGEVIEVIGDESKYTLHWSGDWRNLFIRPKVEVGETIEVSLIIPQGGAQDIRFTVGDTSAQTIFIKLGDDSKTNSSSAVLSPFARSQLKSEMIAMMRAMISGESGEYYVRASKRILQKTKERAISQKSSYRYRDLSGAILSVKNLTTKPLSLVESDFKSLFNGTIAINLGSRLIEPKAITQVFIITREAPHD
jgi:hypothetical protein